MDKQQGPLWECYLGRAEDILPVTPQDVRLLVTDPPYGKSHESNWRPQPMEGDDVAGREMVYKGLTLAVSRFIAANQHLYVFGEWDMTRIGSVFKSVELVWDKRSPAMGDLSIPWSRNYEPIQFAVGHKTARNKSEELMRKRRGSVLSYWAITGTRAFRHPTEKPVRLIRELIEASSQHNDLVLDPYMGSGSTGVAALLEGRRFRGIEVEPGYFEEACTRLRNAEAAWLAQEGM